MKPSLATLFSNSQNEHHKRDGKAPPSSGGVESSSAGDENLQSGRNETAWSLDEMGEGSQEGK